MPRCGAIRTQFLVAKRSQVALNTQLRTLVWSGGSALASGHGEHARLDSNQRLLPPEGSALSTELRARDCRAESSVRIPPPATSRAAGPAAARGGGVSLAKVTGASPIRARPLSVRV